MKVAQRDSNESLIHTLQVGKAKPQTPGAGFRHLKQGMRMLFGIPLLAELLYELIQLKRKS